MSTPTKGMPGLVLAELNGVAYVQVTGVFAVRGDDIAYYSEPAEFEHSAVMIEVKRRKRIAQLEIELATLRSVSPPPELLPPAPKKQRRLATAVAAQLDGSVLCPHCGKTCKNAHGLSVHLGAAHAQAEALPTPPAPPEPAEVADPKAEARS